MNFPSFYLIRIGGIETSASIGIHAFEQCRVRVVDELLVRF